MVSISFYMVHLIPDHGHPCDQCQNSARTKCVGMGNRLIRIWKNGGSRVYYYYLTNVMFGGRTTEIRGILESMWVLFVGEDLATVMFGGGTAEIGGPWSAYGSCS